MTLSGDEVAPFLFAYRMYSEHISTTPHIQYKTVLFAQCKHFTNTNELTKCWKTKGTGLKLFQKQKSSLKISIRIEFGEVFLTAEPISSNYAYRIL